MDTQYYIQLTLLTPEGTHPYGRLDLGEDRESALAIWSQLEGDGIDIAKTPLQMEWVESDRLLPVEVRIKGCTLAQLASNCSLIVKALFKRHSLGSDPLL